MPNNVPADAPRDFSIRTNIEIFFIWCFKLNRQKITRFRQLLLTSKLNNSFIFTQNILSAINKKLYVKKIKSKNNKYSFLFYEDLIEYT